MEKLDPNVLSFSKKIVLAMGVSLFIALMASSFPFQVLITNLENKAIDYLFLIRDEPERNRSPIVIVLIDDESSMEYGFRSPTPRKLLVDLINDLLALDTSVIGLDVLLDQKLNKIDDEALVKTLEHAGERLVLINQRPVSPEQPHRKQHRKTTGQTHSIFKNFNPSGYSEVRSGSGDIVRWIKVGVENKQYPFSSEIYFRYTGQYPKINNRYLSASPIGKNWIRLNFPGAPTRLTDTKPTFSIYSSKEVKHLPDGFFKNSIVLVGSGIEELGDIYLTPFSVNQNGYLPIFGIELHAIALDMFFNHQLLTDINLFWRTGLTFLILTLAAWIFLSLKPFVSFLSMLGFIVATFTISAFLFINTELVIPIISILISIIMLFIFCQLLINTTILRYTSILKKTFERVENVLVQSKKELRDLSAYQQNAIELERTRIARELHDDLGQNLTSLRFDLNQLLKRLPLQQKEVKRKALDMMDLIGRSMQSMRKIISDLRPGLLDDLGLIAAIEWLSDEFVNRTQIKCTVQLYQIDNEKKFSDQVSIVLFRIVQEALNNVLKHANASRVRIRIRMRSEQLELLVTDNGLGIRSKEPEKKNRFGLLGVKERLLPLQGVMNIRGINKRGTTLKISIPMNPVTIKSNSQ